MKSTRPSGRRRRPTSLPLTINRPFFFSDLATLNLKSFPTMAEQAVEETTGIYPSFSSEFHSIAIPPLPVDHFCNSSSDQALLGNSISDLTFLIDGDLDLTLDDSVDDIYFPSENELFFVVPPNREMSCDFTPVSGISSEDEDKKTRCLLSTSSCYNQESPRDSDCSGAANCVSDILEATNALSSLGSGNVVVDHKFNVEEEALTTSSLTKRRKEIEEIDGLRIYKYRRSDEDGAACWDFKRQSS